MLKFLEKKDNDKGIKLKKATNFYPIFIPDFIVKKTLMMREEEGECFLNEVLFFGLNRRTNPLIYMN
jgi:hypothetical protein